jgi:hypothetical protein
MVRTDFKSLQAFREAPERFVDDPMSVVDDESFDYETKLHLLQHWLARITDGDAPDAGRTNVEAAIQALQARAKLKTEEPKGRTRDPHLRRGRAQRSAPLQCKCAGATDLAVLSQVMDGPDNGDHQRPQPSAERDPE